MNTQLYSPLGRECTIHVRHQSVWKGPVAPLGPFFRRRRLGLKWVSVRRRPSRLCKRNRYSKRWNLLSFCLDDDNRFFLLRHDNEYSGFGRSTPVTEMVTLADIVRESKSYRSGVKNPLGDRMRVGYTTVHSIECRINEMPRIP